MLNKKIPNILENHPKKKSNKVFFATNRKKEIEEI